MFLSGTRTRFKKLRICIYTSYNLKFVILPLFDFLGYALLESGIVSRKNEVNILVKNATNVLIGGVAYWIFGYALSFGKQYSDLWISIGSFFTTAETKDMGVVYSNFVFEVSQYFVNITSVKYTIVSFVTEQKSRIDF